MMWFSSRKAASFSNSTVAFRSSRITAPLRYSRSPARSVMFIAASLQAVADDLVDFDQRIEIRGRAGADTVDFPVDPDSDRNYARAQRLRQAVFRAAQILEEDRPK